MFSPMHETDRLLVGETPYLPSLRGGRTQVKIEVIELEQVRTTAADLLGKPHHNHLTEDKGWRTVAQLDVAAFTRTLAVQRPSSNESAR